MKTCQIKGDLKTEEEALINLGFVYFLKGQLLECSVMMEKAQNSSSLRGDHLRNLPYLSIASYLTGDFDHCNYFLNQVVTSCKQTGESLGILLQINFTILQALLFARKGEVGQAWLMAEIVFGLMVNITPTRFSSYFGFAYLPEVYLYLFEDESNWER